MGLIDAAPAPDLLAAFQRAATAALVDASGRLVEVSEPLGELLGQSSAQLLERALGELFDGTPEVQLFHQSAVLEADAGWREVVALRRGEGRLYVELVVQPLAGDGLRLVLFNQVSRPRSAELEVLRTALEDASQASAQRLQFLFDGVPAMVYSAEADGDFGARFMSPNVRSCLGYQPRDFVDGAFWRANIHPEDVASALLEAASVRQVKWQSLQYRFRHRDGSYRWMLDECRLVDGPGHKRPKIFGYWMDITARKDAELALQETREQVAALQTGTELGCWELDPRSSTFLLDRAAGLLLGIDGEGHPERLAAAAQALPTRFHPDDAPIFETRLREHLLGERSIFHLELRARDEHGRWRWLRLRGRVTAREESGRPIWLTGTMVDITQRRLAEEAAVRAHAAVEAATDGMVVVDARTPEQGILYANPAFFALTGYAWEEVVGRNCRFLQGLDREQPAIAELRAALAAGRACQVTLRNYRKDGTRFWNELSVAPVFEADGTLSHFVGVMHDATTRRRLEEELRQAQKMEAFGQLAGGVAHDFNNLLTVILAGTTLLQEGAPLSAEALAEVQSIAGAAERGSDLTRQLLAFSRRSIRSTERVDLGGQLTEMCRLLRRVLGEDIVLESDIPTGLPPVQIDRGLLDQVIMNLAVNARDAMPRGGRLQLLLERVVLDETTARRDSQARPGTFLCLRVRDSGCGIAPDHLPHLFEPFFTTKPVGRGTGLGLATAYGIVKQHHGWIEVESSVGVGTQMSVFLPIVGGEPSSQDLPVVRVRGGRETILVVEDEAPVRRAARALLERLGYVVREAESGDAALSLLEQQGGEIALVFTDMVMPGKTSGQTLAEAIEQRHPRIPVIFTSGYSPELNGGARAIRPGRNFLQKPYRENELAAALRAMLDGPGA